MSNSTEMEESQPPPKPRKPTSVKETEAALESVDRDASGVSAVTFPGGVEEASPLMREVQRLYEQVVHEVVDRSGHSEKVAHEIATRPPQDSVVARIQATAPQDMNWGHLSMLMHRDPALVVAEWERIKTEALAKVQSGYAAAEVLETPRSQSPYDRAMFLAVRETLRQEWQPRNGIEILLIDRIAQVHVLQMRWMTILVRITEDNEWIDETQAGALPPEQRRAALTGPDRSIEIWREPRLSQTKAMELAAQQVERFDRMSVRLIRNLRDMRRFLPLPPPPSVTINNPAQVNVGQQQINVAADTESPMIASPIL